MECNKNATASCRDNDRWSVSAVIRAAFAVINTAPAIKRSLLNGLFVIFPLLPVASSRADGDMTLVFKVRASRPACTVTSDKNGTIVVPNVKASDFDGGNKDIKTGGSTFRLTLTNCTAAGGLLVPKIQVWGNRSITASGNYWLFSDANSTAKGVGFAFRYNSTSFTTGSWLRGSAPPNMTTQATAAKLDVSGNAPGALMNGKTMDFWVNASSDGSGATTATAGVLTASMHFDVVFE